MPRSPRIGLACPLPGERAALLDWLSSAGFDPVPMIDADSVTRELAGSGFEALIADADLVSESTAAPWMATLGGNRPIIVIGDVHSSAREDAHRRGATFLARPVTRELALLTVSLALAEGRPARRSLRLPVARIPATVDAVPSVMVDVSYEGIRLEIPGQDRSSLPPTFKVQVPLLRVGVIVKRVWVTNAPSIPSRPSSVLCGVSLQRNTGTATEAWRSFVDHAPSHTQVQLYR